MQDSQKYKKIIIISTGGTIEKTYDEADGSLQNRGAFLKETLLTRIRLPHTEFEYFSIMSKDSLDMTVSDTKIICQEIDKFTSLGHPVIVIHGTDTMEVTAKYCWERLNDKLKAPVVFTGAMKPFGFIDSDAYQNLVEALLAVRIIKPAVYIVFHNKIFEVPNVTKDRKRKTFVKITNLISE